jgi:hypothetical protein
LATATLSAKNIDSAINIDMEHAIFIYKVHHIAFISLLTIQTISEKTGIHEEK